MELSDFEKQIRKKIQEKAARESGEDSDPPLRNLPSYLLAGLTGAERFGPFELHSQLGVGAFGVVFLARDTRTGRTLALKLPLPQVILDSKVKNSFVRDARAGLRLDHPGIVKVHEFDEIDGIPYIASEYVEGPTLEGLLKSRKDSISVDTAVDLAIRIADAIDHAHTRGVVHRDLKPANILLRTVVDESATFIQPMITDFGLARVRDIHGLSATKTGAIVGSIPYMAPEQIKGSKDAVGPCTDIYALGVILYRMLTGSMPFSENSGVSLMDKIVRDQPEPVRSRRSSVPLPLATICEKCLRKKPHKRFASAAELREDLRRFHRGERIASRPVPRAEKAVDWCRRNPAPTVAMLAGVSIIGLQTYQVRELWHVNAELTEARDMAVSKEREAEDHARRAEVNLKLANERNRLVQRYFYDRRLLDAQAAIADRNVLLAQQILTEIDPGEADREFVWKYLWRKSREKMELIPREDRTSVVERIWNPGDGRWLMVVNSIHKLQIFDTTDWSLAGEIDFSAYPGNHVHDTGLSNDGRRIYARIVVPSPEGPDRHPAFHVATWDTSERKTIDVENVPPVGKDFNTQLFPDSGTLFVWGRQKGDEPFVMREDDLANRTSKELSLGDDYFWFKFSEDGKKFLAVNRNGKLYLVDTRDPRNRRELKYTGEARWGEMWFHEENGLVLLKTIVRIEGQEHSRILGWKASFEGRGDPVLTHAVPYDREFFFWPLAAKNLVLIGKQGGTDGLLQNGMIGLLDLESGKTTPLELDRADPGFGKNYTINSMESIVHDGTLFTPGNQQGLGGRWLAWDLKTKKQVIDPSFPEYSRLYASTGREFLYGSHETKLFRWWPKREFAIPETLAEIDDEAWCAAFTPDSARIITGTDDNSDAPTLKAWDRATGKTLWAVKAHRWTVSVMAMDPDGKVVATGALDDSSNVRLWDTATGRMTAELKGLDLNVRALKFNHDGSRLAAGDKKGRCVVWDVASGEVVRDFPAGIDRVLHLAFSADGDTLISSTEDGWIRIWNLADGSKLREFYTGFLTQALTIGPDLKTAAGIAHDGRLFVVDFETGANLRFFEMPSMKPWAILLFPDGKTLAAGDKDGNLMMWDLETGTEKFRVQAHKAQINALVLSPDGKTLVSCAHDSTVRLWHAGPEF
ncbi:protein kinase [bacterium]|nr:protein kinase [bacterium]